MTEEDARIVATAKFPDWIWSGDVTAGATDNSFFVWEINGEAIAYVDDFDAALYKKQ